MKGEPPLSLSPENLHVCCVPVSFLVSADGIFMFSEWRADYFCSVLQG